MFITYPVSTKSVSQPFGRDTTNDPVYGKFYKVFNNKHSGVDFPVPVGTSVFASFSGIVVRAENHPGMGKVIGIRNGNIVALYAHLSKTLVKPGNVIQTGKLIGISGSTGKACPSPHLHFELRNLSKPSLAKMVFDPPFNKKVKQFTNVFVYVVNNKNTPKTLRGLSLLFFGTERKWKIIQQANHLQNNKNTILRDGMKITIPNILPNINCL